MLGVGSPTAGGDPLLSTTAGGARGNYAVKLESGSALEELLSCLQALPISHQHQSWQLRQHQDSITKNIHVQVSVMEQVHGVDVSWLHRPQKDHHLHRKPARPSAQNDAQPAEAESGGRPYEAEAAIFTEQRRKSNAVNALRQVTTAPSAPHHAPPPPPTTPPKKTTNRPSIAPTQPENSARPSPLALSRSISEPLREKGKADSRRSSSWISSLGNKFSSDKKSSKATPNSTTSTPNNSTPPAGQSGSSVFSSISRKLSTPQINVAAGKTVGKGGICERRTLNVDPNRQRCHLPEMDVSRLRKVAFCVDVEIAGGPRFNDDEDLEDRKPLKKDAKLKERAEGEALKNPEAIQKAKDEMGPAPLDVDADKALLVAGEGDAALEDGSLPAEKKKRTDEERKARQEKRRRRAEENGSVPLEFVVDSDESIDPKSSPRASSIKSTSPPATARERPTSDPARIYRRCCQLRETPILKRITEQLMSPSCCTLIEPGVVQCLDLKGSRLQLADMVTLGDWLAVVPVKKLLLEDADLTDEGLRCILAGLLASKQPRPKRRRNSNPKHRSGIKPVHVQQRSGIVEKLTLKNNPRITRNGWKHISLFLYMCRSIKAIDLSMIQFPDTLPMSPKANPSTPKNMDAAELFFKCISERLGGSQLEELIVSECGLNAVQIGKVVSAAVRCGITRLGLAGNHIDDDGLQHVLHYLRSGACACLDIGGNDLRGKLHLIADALRVDSKIQCWGLSLAGCNLDTASLKTLFPTLQRLPNFRFIDLSHNQDLCRKDDGTISLLRRYLAQMKTLKRIHLADVSMSSKQAIKLADVLAEAPQLAHISIIENPEITALASAQDEAGQEEACALYASYMAAVRCSSTLICIDVDVPTTENSEIVKALAKQVVAYSLRNMERFAIAEATGMLDTSSAAASLADPHGGERQVREVVVPDILMSLVGHVDGVSENHDGDEPAPDEDYIVGGAGVVKALQYILGEKANDLRRSVTNTPVSGTWNSVERPGSSYGIDEAKLGRAKKMSTNLLNSARKIRSRLQPALIREETSGDEMAYRRLMFLDETLRNMIQRFEEEYPETRIVPPSPRMSPADVAFVRKHSNQLSINTSIDEAVNKSDDDDISDDERAFRPSVPRNNSEVSLASRALSLEEGHLHRLGQRLRREVVDSPASSFSPNSDLWQVKEEEQKRMRDIQERVEGISGYELKSLVEQGGWEFALAKLGTNAADLRGLQEQDPQAWEMFVESQLKARMNLEQHTR